MATAVIWKEKSKKYFRPLKWEENNTANMRGMEMIVLYR